MKRYFHFFALACVILAGGGIAGCSKDDTEDPVIKEPVFSAQLLSTDIDAAAVRLTTESIGQYAYTATTDATAVVTPDGIFAAAEAGEALCGKGSCQDGTTDIKVSGLNPETSYKLYLAAKATDGTYYKDVVAVDFTTVDSPAVFEVELQKAGTSTAEVKLTTSKITKYAYLAYPSAEAPETAPTPTILFATGISDDVIDGENVITVRALQPNTPYVVYFAAQTVKEEYFETVAKIELTTEDFTDAVTVYDNTNSGFKVAVKVPADVKEKNHVIKWGTSSLFNYNMQGALDSNMLILNDQYYHNYFNEDTTLLIDNDHCYVLDENGELEIDEWGDYKQVFDPVIPGQPQVIILGEHEWGESLYGWGEGYYTALFDEDAYYAALGEEGGDDPWGPLMSKARKATRAVNPDDFWTGFHHRETVVVGQPEQLDAEIRINTSALRPNGGMIQIDTDPEVVSYSLLVTETETLGMILQFLDNNMDYLPWFVESYDAMMNLGTITASGALDINLEDVVYLDKTATYYVLVTGRGDDEGTSICFAQAEFQLPEPTKPAPVVEVKGIEKPATEGEPSPFEVWFNVKCTTKDAETAIYGCNYEREWETTKGTYYSDADLVERAGNKFSAVEIAQINTDEGLNIMFDTREDANTYLGVIAYNDEGTASEAAVGTMRSIREPAAQRIESDLFTSLDGDWTATATITYQLYNNETYKTETITEEMSCKVTIGNVTYPATLSDEVYATYEKIGKDKETTDAYFAEFKEVADIFNEKTRGQNRILCNGFDFEVSRYGGDMVMTYASPFELFSSNSYNAYDNESILYDFGPKWYLQVAADGTVTVPFNVNYFFPMSQWTRSTYHLIGASEQYALPYWTDGTTGNFPVEISADKNTITVKPVEFNEQLYYPVGASANFTSWSFNSRTISNIVLTRGWTETPETAALKAGRVYTSKIDALNGMKYSPVMKAKNRTPFKTIKKRSQIDYSIVGREQFIENAKASLKKSRQAR